jgi:1-acyl-sn-glycerol-3-phosphate acyltransferase
MKQTICRFIYTKILGWKAVVSIPNFDKCIVCAAPHTSNWDLFMGKLFYAAIGRETGFLMKQEWFFFPLNLIWKIMGGIPVNRGKHTSLVAATAEKIKSTPKISVAVTPEGTRSANKRWKRGFYYMAIQAEVPLVLVGIDYKKKTIFMEKVFTPTGDYQKDIQEIKNYYKGFTGKVPKNFAI